MILSEQKRALLVSKIDFTFSNSRLRTIFATVERCLAVVDMVDFRTLGEVSDRRVATWFWGGVEKSRVRT